MSPRLKNNRIFDLSGVRPDKSTWAPQDPTSAPRNVSESGQIDGIISANPGVSKNLPFLNSRRAQVPLRSLPNSALQYHLISYDKHGVERSDDPDAKNGLMSEEVLATLAREPVTDVFILSHGWLNDVDSAVASYDQWIGAMAQNEEDLQAMGRFRPNFRPLLIGLHWPSCPFGNERLSTQVSFGIGQDPFADLLDKAMESFDGGPRSKEALQTILASANDDMAPDQMPEDVADAYQVLWQDSGLSFAGPSGAPGEDARSFDPAGLYEEALDDDISFGGGLIGGLLAPLRPLSFWKMKQRARHFGELGGATFLRTLQNQTDTNVHFHLMGHSFGCIVASAMVAGAGGDQPLPRPVDTLFLAQGAVSCWSFAPQIPIAPGKSGYFASIHQQGKVTGPFVTTQSKYDSAVGKAYRLATTSSQVSFAPGATSSQQPPPPDGSLGTFGARGTGLDSVAQPMLAADASYAFEGGKIYNLEGSQYICEGRIPFLGAHCDIAKPEVAHAFWSAVMAAQGS